MAPYVPLIGNPHLATIAGSFWPRPLDEKRHPVEAKLFATAPDVRVLVHIQQPDDEPLGEAVLVHGLEGSSLSGYMRSMAAALLEAGLIVHRMNIRSCGGTEILCPTLYHAGLTHDLFTYIMDLDRQRRTPLWLIGFSLGGNIVLKLAGEMGGDAARVLAGVAAVSAPIDLAACARAIGKPSNRLYEWKFLSSMKRRLRERLRAGRDVVDTGFEEIGRLWDFDDRITARAFGFGDAPTYYSTQSALRFVREIRVPTLLIQAKDDPLIPFEVFDALPSNRFLRLVSTERGGHVAFLQRGTQRFWADGLVRDWISDSA